MAENEALRRAPDNQQSPENKTNIEKTEEKGPTEKLREQAKPQVEHLVPGAGVPGVQKPDTQELKDEANPNTE
jgi:hypothetical protein